MIVLAVATADADPVKFVMDNAFSGSGTPSGAPEVTIEDVADGKVKLTFDATGLSSTTEKIDRWYLNTTFDISCATITGFTNLSGYVGFPDIWYSFDSTHGDYKADGDGYFDLVLDFANSGSGKFKDNEKFSFYIHLPGLSASTFDGWSLPGGGNVGPFQSALHLLGVGPYGQQSLWLAPGGTSRVPEPAPVALLAVAGFAVLLVRRRRLRQRASARRASDAQVASS